MVPRDHVLSLCTIEDVALQYSTVHNRTAQYITVTLIKINLLGGLDAEKQLKNLFFPFYQKSKMATISEIKIKLLILHKEVTLIKNQPSM